MSTVNIACKLPHGLILQLWNMVEVQRPTAGGGMMKCREARLNVEAGSVKINGYLKPWTISPPHSVTSKYEVTEGIDANFWGAWLDQNKTHAAVVNKLIFAQEKSTELQAEIKDNAFRTNGLEPLDPNNLPSQFKKKIVTADTGV